MLNYCFAAVPLRLSYLHICSTSSQHFINCCLRNKGFTSKLLLLAIFVCVITAHYLINMWTRTQDTIFREVFQRLFYIVIVVVMLSLFWTRTSAAAPIIVSVSRYRKDLQLSPGNGNVSIFALVPVPCLSGASLTPFPPEVAACSARVERFTLSSGPPLPEERSRFSD